MREELKSVREKPSFSPHERLKYIKHNEGAANARPGNAAPESLISEVQQLMWNKVGIVRTGQGLREAVERLHMLALTFPQRAARRVCEASNIHAAALLIARLALARLESRGAHYRTDYPAHDDVKFRKHSVIKGAAIRFE